MSDLDISYKRIWKIAYPIILGSVAQNIISVTDTAFLGRVSEVALGAGAVASIFYLAVFMLGWGFGIGLQIIIARRLGEKNYLQIGKTLDHGFYFMLVIGVGLILLTRFLAPEFLRQSVQSASVYKASMSYLNVRIWGLVFAFINVSFRALYVGIIKTKVITYTTFVVAFFNVLFDYLLIFGNLGFPELGIKGAAYASFIAEISASLFFILYTRFRLSYRDFAIFQFFKPNFKELKRILQVAFPVMMQSFISIFAWFLFFLMVENLGERPLAISNIIRSLYVLMMIPIMGFSSAANTLVSYLIGKDKIAFVRKLIIRIAVLCFSGVVVLSIIGATFPASLLRIYTDNIDLIRESIPVLYVVSGSAPLVAIGFVLYNSVSGTGRTDASFLIEMIVLLVYLLAVFYITHQDWATISQVWMVEYLYGILLILFPILYLRFGNWQKAKV